MRKYTYTLIMGLLIAIWIFIVLNILSMNVSAVNPTLIIDDVSGDNGTITIYYTAFDADGDQLTTIEWQYSTDNTTWYDIDSYSIGNNQLKPIGSSYVTWNTKNGKNNLDGTDDDSIWFRMKAYEGVYMEYFNSYDVSWDSSYNYQNHNGVAYDGSFIFSVCLFDNGNQKNRIFELSSDGLSRTSYVAPGDDNYVASGLAYDGTYLWYSYPRYKTIYKGYISGVSFSIVDSYDMPSSFSFIDGLTWDGTNLWAVQSNGVILKLDSDLSIIESYNSPSSNPTGIAWDGTNIWTSDFGTNKVYKHYMDASLSIKESYQHVGSSVSGLTYSDVGLLASDSVDKKIYSYNAHRSNSTYSTFGPFPLDNNDVPIANITTPSDEQITDITIYYELIDTESDILSIVAQYSADGTTFYDASMGTGGEGLSGLSSSPSGVWHTFVWKSTLDLDGVDDSSVYFRITPSDLDIGTPYTTPGFHVDYNDLPSTSVTSPTGEFSEEITIDYVLSDPESDTLSIYPRYSTDGTTFYDATMGAGGDGKTGLTSSPSGISHTFVWDSISDLNGVDAASVYFRIIPCDLDNGTNDTTTAFHVDNNDIPSVTINTPTGEKSGNISINYKLIDAESDSLSIVVEYSMDGSIYYDATIGSGGDGSTGLSSSPSGVWHIFAWESGSDLDSVDNSTIYFRITPSDLDTGISSTSNTFHVDNNRIPSTSISTPSGEQSGEICISYVLIDAESDTLSITAQFSTDGTTFYDASMGAGGDGLSGLTSSPSGVWHNYFWNSTMDLDGLDDSTVYFRIIPTDIDTGTLYNTTAFHVDNNDLPSISITYPIGEFSGNIAIDYELNDPESDTLSIYPKYSTDGTNFYDASMGAGGDGLTGLISSPAGIPYTFIWDSATDLNGIDTTSVYFRIIPCDLDNGTSDTTAAFHIDNNDGPSVIVNTPSGEQNGDITIIYKLIDVESDTLSITAQYSTDGTTFYDASMGAGGDGLSGLSSSPSGVWHTFEWRTTIDLDGLDDSSVYFRIIPNDLDMGTLFTTSAFHVDYNDLPSVSIISPSEDFSFDIPINYTLYDTESDTLSIYPQYSIDDVTFYNASIGTGSDGLIGLISSPSGISYTFVWDSNSDLNDIDAPSVYFRIVPYDMDEGENDTTTSFHVDNNDIPSVTINKLSSVQSRDITIDYKLIDSESDTLSIMAHYSIDGIFFYDVTMGTGGDGLTGLSSSPTGRWHTFIWDSGADLDGMENTVYFRLTPKDNDEGLSYTSSFILDNKAPTILDTAPEGIQTSINVTLTVITSENASCRWSNTNQSYINMPNNNQFTIGEGTTSHSTPVIASEGQNTFYVSAVDTYENAMSYAVTITFIVDLSASDTQPPRIINYGPTTLQTSLEVVIYAITNENAKMRWSIINQGYNDMPLSNQFSTGERTTAHSTSVTAVEGTNTFYISAIDMNSNAMNDATAITFIVDLSASDIQPPEIINYGPTTLQTSLEVVIYAITNENANMRWSLTNRGYNDMPSKNQFATGEGTTAHSTSVVAVEGSNTFYISAIDMNGNAMNDTIAISFNVNLSAVHMNPPFILSFSPTGSNVPINSYIMVTFSKEMDHSSVESSFIKDLSLNGIFSWNGTTLYFNPDPNLDYDTYYNVTVNTSARDVMGNSLEYPTSWTFRTTEEPRSIEKDDRQDLLVIIILGVICGVISSLIAYMLIKFAPKLIKKSNMENDKRADIDDVKEKNKDKGKKEEMNEGVKEIVDKSIKSDIEKDKNTNKVASEETKIDKGKKKAKKTNED